MLPYRPFAGLREDESGQQQAGGNDRKAHANSISAFAAPAAAAP